MSTIPVLRFLPEPMRNALSEAAASMVSINAAAESGGLASTVSAARPVPTNQPGAEAISPPSCYPPPPVDYNNPSMSTIKPKILVTNDDAVHAPGLHKLAARLRRGQFSRVSLTHYRKAVIIPMAFL